MPSDTSRSRETLVRSRASSCNVTVSPTTDPAPRTVQPDVRALAAVAAALLLAPLTRGASGTEAPGLSVLARDTADRAASGWSCDVLGPRGPGVGICRLDRNAGVPASADPDAVPLTRSDGPEGGAAARPATL